MEEFKVSIKTLNVSFEKNDINDILANIKIVSDTYLKNDKFIIDISNNLSDLKNSLDFMSSWILKSFNSSKLTSVLQYASLLLEKCGYKIMFPRNELENILLKEIRTLGDNNVKLNEKQSKETKEVEDKINLEKIIFTNQFLNSLYALFVTISSKSEIILKSKSLVKVSLSLIAQISNEKSAIIFLKKKRLFSDFNKILMELYKNLNNEELQEIISGDLMMFLLIYSKIGKARSKS